MPIFETEKSGFKEVLSMKRWLSILAVLGCIVALSGCKNEAEQAYFNAKVLEVNKEYVDVRCIEVRPRYLFDKPEFIVLFHSYQNSFLMLFLLGE